MHTLWQRCQGCGCLHLQGCREVARLVGEVEDIRKTMGSLKMMVMGQGVEENGGETRGSSGRTGRS